MDTQAVEEAYRATMRHAHQQKPADTAQAARRLVREANKLALEAEAENDRLHADNDRYFEGLANQRE